MEQNFAVPPGMILKEYMDSRKINQKELAKLTNSSERHVSNLINGKIKLTEEFAIKLENVFPDIEAQFWLDLETAYRLYVLRNKNNNVNNLIEISKEFHFKHVFKGMKLSLQEQAIKMLKLLQVDSFDEVLKKFNDLAYNFMEDGGDKKLIYLWLKLCEEEIIIQNDIDSMPKFNQENLLNKVNIFKQLMYTQNFELACRNLRRFSNQLGIALVILEAVPNSKVRGASKQIDNRPVIFLSTRFKRLDTFYFAFMHEIAHILNDNLSDKKYQILLETDEELIANSFARNYFINHKKYEIFIKQHPSQDKITENDIITFSLENKIIPDILLGFLEHDKIINNQSQFYHLKEKI